jgi:hypothetical protein
VIKRTRAYAVVRGVTIDDDTKEIINTEGIVDGRHRSAEAVTKIARKQYPNMLIKDIEFHEQECTLDDKTFYANAEFGEDRIVEPNDINTPDASAEAAE